MGFASRRKKMLVEPPAVLLTDLAFNLVIFFVVCASTDPQSGRKQDIPPGAKDSAQAKEKAETLPTVYLTPKAIEMVALLSIGVASVSLAQDTGGSAPAAQGTKTPKKHKKHAKKHKKHKTPTPTS